MGGEPAEPQSRVSYPVTLGMSIEQLVDDCIYKYHFRMSPVVIDAERHLAGCVSTRDVSEIPRDEWPVHTVEEVLKPCSLENTVAPDADALSVLSKMGNSGVSRMLAADKAQLLAVISLKDLVNFIASKLASTDLFGKA